ncbi:unnamed protein product [Moneuplotes crassus]|uniref:Uncharacterized protein n=1 Tax=Euplotes crassus TaxID=5936 RepID=A0AAD1XEL0_EUPCR|nr:unnamed protein product [Moneuplotes crassus]
MKSSNYSQNCSSPSARIDLEAHKSPFILKNVQMLMNEKLKQVDPEGSCTDFWGSSLEPHYYHQKQFSPSKSTHKSPADKLRRSFKQEIASGNFRNEKLRRMLKNAMSRLEPLKAKQGSSHRGFLAKIIRKSYKKKINIKRDQLCIGQIADSKKDKSTRSKSVNRIFGIKSPRDTKNLSNLGLNNNTKKLHINFDKNQNERSQKTLKRRSQSTIKRLNFDNQSPSPFTMIHSYHSIRPIFAEKTQPFSDVHHNAYGAKTGRLPLGVCTTANKMSQLIKLNYTGTPSYIIENSSTPLPIVKGKKVLSTYE